MNPLAVAESRSTISTARNNAMEDVMKFLGPPVQSTTPSAYDRVSTTNYDLPEFYKGRNLFIRDTIDNLIIDNNEWYTTECLPWAYSEELHIKFNEWHFNTVLADRVPHEGISRLVTSSKKTFMTHVVRRGLAFMVEADFYTTEEGRQHYARNIQGIATCVQETSNHDTIHGLLTCKNLERLWNDKYGHLGIDFERIIQGEITDFACLCKNGQKENKLDILIEEYKHLMGKHRVVPDMLILAPRSTIYLSMGQERQQQNYSLTNGATEFKQGPSSKAYVRGLEVFQTRDFEVSDEPAIDLMTRRVQIGERYEMVFRDHRGSDISDYTSKWRDIFIENRDIDDLQKVFFKDAIRASFIFGSDGKYHSKLQSYVNKLNAGINKKRKPDGAPANFDGVDSASYNFFPFIITDKSGRKSLAEYFGQMLIQNATTQDFTQVAQTMVSKIFGKTSQELEIWDDMIKLIGQIESQDYDREYVRRLIEKNQPRSTDADGNWVGENTPSDLYDHWHSLPQLSEWVPDSTGGLSLPERPENVLYPIGGNNWPTILALANEVNNLKSTWAHLAKRASKIVEFVHKFVNVMQRLAPNSEAIDPRNRSPWFHRRDAANVFYETCVAIPRDPAFLPHLPGIQRGNAVKIPTGKDGSTDVNMPWNPIPFLRWPTDLPKDPRLDKYLAKYTELSDEDVKEGLPEGETSVKYVTPNGETIEVPSDCMANSAVLSREARALTLMGVRSFPDLLIILERISALKPEEDAKKTRENLLKFINTMGTVRDSESIKRLRATIRGLVSIVDDAELKDTIDVIYVPSSTATAKRKAAAKDKIKKLSEAYIQTDDKNIQDFERFYEPTTVAKDIPKKQEIADAMDVIIETAPGVIKTRRANGLPAPAYSVYSDYYHTVQQGDNASNIAKLVAARKVIIDSLNLGKREPRESEKKNPPAEVVLSFVDDSDNSVKCARFYRAPLTMSYRLFETIAKEVLPLIRPGDPTTGFTQPYAYDSDDESSLNDVLRRPNYAHIDEVIRTDIKGLDTTNFIRRNIGFKFDSKPIGADYGRSSKRMKTIAGHKKKKSIFADEDSDDDCSSSETEKMQTEHYDSDFENPDENVGWTHEQLKRKTKRGEMDKRRPFEVYSDLYHKLFTNTCIYRFKDANKISDPLLRSAVIVFLMTPIDGNQIERMIDDNVHVPLNVMLWRLFIEHDMSSAIMMKRGLGTGANIYGHSNFVTGNDVMTKVIYGNFTFNSKSVVYNEKNVMIIENIKPQGYFGGLNCKFMTSPKDMEVQGKGRPSIMATVLPITENTFPFAMSFLGFHMMNDINQTINGKQEPHYSTFDYYDHIWELGEKIQGHNIAQQHYFDVQDRPNIESLQGLQFNYNTSTREYDRFIECKGHRGRDGCGRGVSEVWNGSCSYFERQDYTTYRLQ